MLGGKTFEEVEEVACRNDGSLAGQYLGMAISMIRDLQHKLDHPNFQYGGSRIHRQAIISRNEELARLRVENQKLRDEIAELKKDKESK